jgi:hypothetical protein
VSFARRKNCLAGGFEFRRILRHAEVLVQISSDPEENRADTRNRGDFVDILQGFGRFDPMLGAKKSVSRLLSTSKSEPISRKVLGR